MRNLKTTNVTLQNLFLNGENVKKLSIIGICSIVGTFIIGILSPYIEIPKIITYIVFAPFAVYFLGFIFLGGPILRILKDNLSNKDTSTEKYIVGISGFLNFLVGMVIINLMILKPLEIGSVSHFTMPSLTIPSYIIACLFTGNILYSTLIAEKLLKKFF